MAAFTTEEFEQTFRSLYKPLCLYALRYTGQTDDAEDIVQQAFADVWDKQAATSLIGNSGWIDLGSHNEIYTNVFHGFGVLTAYQQSACSFQMPCDTIPPMWDPWNGFTQNPYSR